MSWKNRRLHTSDDYKQARKPNPNQIQRSFRGSTKPVPGYPLPSRVKPSVESEMSRAEPPDKPRQAGPVAQSVERWTPYGGSIRPGFKSPGFEARRAPDVYRASWRVWLRLVAGRSQSKSAIGTGRARLCAYVKLSTPNSAIDPELRERKVGDRANVTSSA